MNKFKTVLSKRKILNINLIFIFIFLNIWEFFLSGELFSGMILGMVLFGPVAILWFFKSIRLAMLATFISIFEVTILTVFVVEGFQFGGPAGTLKSLYWIPYLLMAVLNMVVGLKIYGNLKAKISKK